MIRATLVPLLGRASRPPSLKLSPLQRNLTGLSGCVLRKRMQLLVSSTCLICSGNGPVPGLVGAGLSVGTPNRFSRPSPLLPLKRTLAPGPLSLTLERRSVPAYRSLSRRPVQSCLKLIRLPFGLLTTRFYKAILRSNGPSLTCRTRVGAAVQPVNRRPVTCRVTFGKTRNFSRSQRVSVANRVLRV